MSDAQKEAPSARLIAQQAEAFREMSPYLDRLQVLGRRLGWPLGELVVRSAVEQLEQDHPRPPQQRN